MSSTAEQKHLRFFGIPAVYPYVKRHVPAIISLVVMGSLASAVDVLMPVYQRYALNHFIGGGTLDTLWLFITLYILTVLFQGVMNYFSCTKATATEVTINCDLRNAAFDHLQTLSFSYFNQNSVGYIHARVMSDTSRVGTLFSWNMLEGTWHVAALIGYILVMFLTNARLALLITAIVPLIAVLFSFFQKKLITVNRSIRETNSKITADFNEGITGAKAIKTLVIERKMHDSFRSDTAGIRKDSVHAARLRGMFAATIHLASSCALAIVLWKGSVIGAEDVGTFSMFMTYAQNMMEPVRWIIDVASDIITTQVNIERFLKLMHTKPDVYDAEAVEAHYGNVFEPKRENWEELHGDIEFRDVTFRYPDGDRNVLEHFNLKIPFGTSVAIVGETGAGKSTLVNLICRFFEPTEGAVLIDGRDARERSQLWLHSAIGYVLQTPHLFSGTVRQNMQYGCENATDEQIMQALRLVSAEDIVARMEKGLDTDVGEGGNTLSTGEKQLLCLARAILSDPRILILDEATASVDTLTEHRIQEAIDTVIRGRTSVVIAHRLSTVRNSDIILVVKDGCIVERGTHQELLRQKGAYCRLYTRQYEDEAISKVLNAG